MMEPFGRGMILGRYETGYHRCPSCGFVCTGEPIWLEEAYSEAITGSDVGLVRRNQQLSGISAVLIRAFFEGGGRFVDYAGGYGLFVRLMRDRGFDFRWYDKYCDNLFARGFEAGEPGNPPAELLTAFEVFEHLVDPGEELERMLAYSRSVLFTTQLLPEPAPRPGEWWYYGPEHGQHIAFYTRKSLALLGERFGLDFYTNGASMHLFTDKRISRPLFLGLARHRISRLLAPFAGRGSLTETDFAAASGSSLTKGNR